MGKKYLIAGLLGIVGLILILIYANKLTHKTHKASSAMSITQAFAFQKVMRELWAAHVVWTREYIVSAVASAEDTKDVADRLLRNQQDIGNAIVPYYGNEAGQKLAELLKEHILIAVDVVAAAKVDDKEKLTKSDARWHENAQEIATFLSGANSHWTKKMLTDMLYDHLRLTTQEAVARIKKQWPDDIKTFDAVFNQAMKMADDLSDGIITQFPTMF